LSSNVFHELHPIVGPSCAVAVVTDIAANNTKDFISFLIVYSLGNNTRF